MKRGLIAAVAVVAALGGPARAAWPQHADRICADFRHRYPAVKAPLAVTVHTPDAKLVDHPSYMRCAPMPGGERLPAVEAEATN